ncbi:MAG TPA: kelch repeat-containing protein [Steroidobacteraceae bacterium]
MTDTLKLLRVTAPCAAFMLLTACGGGGSSASSPGVTTYTVNIPVATGGTVSPVTFVVAAGGTATFTVTANSGYVVSSVSGCGGSLSGNTYTTGAINANCVVTASFSAAFTWVAGPNTTDATGVYGTPGVAAAANVPGSRDGGATWTDANGNLWLFGGFAGYANAKNPATGNFMNDLWEYSPASGEWTWVGGSNAACSQAVYGTQGMAAAANVPGPRTATTSWTDSSGDVWLFGGGGCDSTGTFLLYDDLWKFSPSSGEWTWVGGSTANYANGVYGTEGVAAPANMPGGRAGFARWTDASGNLWLFGGDGYDNSTSVLSEQNDLWEYSPASGEWTWMGGSDTYDASGVYGAQGAAAAANVPGARSGALNWTDAKGNFWLFGGIGWDSTGSRGELNDLWEFSPSAGEWTWVSGSNIANPTGVYGTEGVTASTNVPSARDSGAAWMDTSGNLWLFGGEGYLVSTRYYHRLNDLWKYSPASGEWTWVAGSDTFDATGVYGTRGAAAVANVPGARAAMATWQDSSGTWIFGGYTFDDPTNTRFEMNDLWEYPTQ